MKRALAIIACCLPALAFANAAVFEEAPGTLDGSNNTSVSSAAFSSACPTGSTIEAYVVWNGSTDPSSVVDSASQTYTREASVYSADANVTFTLYVLQNNSSDTTLTVTANWAADVYNNGVWTKCLTGVASTAYQTSAANQQISPGTGANAITSTSLTPTSAPALLSSVSFADSTAALSAGTGFTSGVSGWGEQGLSESEALASTSAIAATYTDATEGGSLDYLTIAASYTAASAGGTPILVTPSGSPIVSESGSPLITQVQEHFGVAAALSPLAWIIERRRRLSRRS